MDYEAFKDLGPNADLPEGHIKTPVHLYTMSSMMEDIRLGWLLGVIGHQPLWTLCTLESGVVSLMGICLVTLMAELIDLELWGTDIRNAYE